MKDTRNRNEAEKLKMLLAFARIAHAGRKAAKAVIAAALLMGMAPRAWSQTSNEQAMEEMQQKIAELKSQLDGMSETQSGLLTDVGGLKKLKVSGYIQARYETHQDRPVNASTPTATADREDGFYIRRGRVKFTYQNSPTSVYVLYPDFSTKDGVTLKEAYVKLIEPWTGHGVNLVVGQQNWFFGREIERSSSIREFPERSRVFGKAVFDGERDKGARIEIPDLPLEGLNVKAGVFNGNGIKSPQAFDNDHYGQFMGRIAYSLGWLDLGVSGEDGKRYAKDANGVKKVTSKHHVGADAFVFYELPLLGGGSLGGEYLEGRGVSNPDSNQTKNTGWYAMAVQNLGDSLQVAARHDVYNPDTRKSKGNDIMRTNVVALNWFMDANVRITYAYEHVESVKSTGDPKDDTQTLQFQYKF